MVQTGSDVALAFGLTFAAGLATVLGGMVVFSKRLIHLTNPTSLAMALSISAGVMMFISLVEIFGKSQGAIAEGLMKEGDEEPDATASGHGWLLATVCFGAGIALVYAIDMVVHKLAPEVAATEIEHLPEARESLTHADGNTKSPVEYVESQTPNGNKTSAMSEERRAGLVRMGLLSGLAIGLHNFPEGIATYVSTLSDSSVGASLAIGIAFHNVPEGIAVAAPIYFATGSRMRAIFWCFVSAMAEPLGATIAWLLIGDGMTPLSEGILFGVVCGIMVCICIKELYPTAYKFAGDREHLVAVGSFIGMFIMVTSLILFGYAGA